MSYVHGAAAPTARPAPVAKMLFKKRLMWSVCYLVVEGNDAFLLISCVLQSFCEILLLPGLILYKALYGSLAVLQ